MQGRRERLKKRFKKDLQRLENDQPSIVVPILNKNNEGQLLEMDKNYAQLSIAQADENNEQEMDFVDYGYTKDSNNNDMIINNDNITLVIYENKDDNYGRVLPDFNIIKEIMLLEENMSLSLCVEDANDRIHSDSKVTKGLLAEAFDEYCHQSKTTGKDRHLLGCLFHNTFSDFCNLPFEAKRKAAEMNINVDDGGENEQSDFGDDKDEEKDSRNLLEDTAVDVTRRYILKQSRFFTFDQCENDCTVFLGGNSRLFRCPTCEKPRFPVCSKTGCETVGTDTCEHLLRDGSSFKKLYYRPIIILIQDLLANPKFEHYLNYESRHNRRHDSNRLSDFMDGEIARAHLNDMKKKWKEWIAKDPDNRRDYIIINLLFSEFYDSGQILSRMSSIFGPFVLVY